MTSQSHPHSPPHDGRCSSGVPPLRPISFLVSTRIVAGMLTITPLYAIAIILSFTASRFTTVTLLGQSPGLYDHYFSTFLNPVDLLWSFVQAIAMAITILLIHTYFGYNASGGPAGVGVATGDAVRASLIAVVSVTLLVSLASTAPAATSTWRGENNAVNWHERQR